MIFFVGNLVSAWNGSALSRSTFCQHKDDKSPGNVCEALLWQDTNDCSTQVWRWGRSCPPKRQLASRKKWSRSSVVWSQRNYSLRLPCHSTNSPVILFFFPLLNVSSPAAQAVSLQQWMTKWLLKFSCYQSNKHCQCCFRCWCFGDPYSVHHGSSLARTTRRCKIFTTSPSLPPTEEVPQPSTQHTFFPVTSLHLSDQNINVLWFLFSTVYSSRNPKEYLLARRILVFERVLRIFAKLVCLETCIWLAYKRCPHPETKSVSINSGVSKICRSWLS